MEEPEYPCVCPRCSSECSVPLSMCGTDVTCPVCSHLFRTDHPAPEPLAELLTVRRSRFVPLSRLPFLQSARQKLLEKELEESLSRNNGITDSLAEADLKPSAILLGLEEGDASSLLSDRFKKEFSRSNGGWSRHP